MKNTRPTAESQYVVRTYNKYYYFDTLAEAIKFAHKRQKQNTCTSVDLYEVARDGMYIGLGKKIEY